MKKFISSIILLCSLTGYSQQFKSITGESFYNDLTKISQHQYQEESYSFVRRMFEDTLGQKMVEKESGLFLKSKTDDYVLAQDNLLIIQKANDKLMVDSAQKIVVLVQAEKFQQPFSLEAFQKMTNEKSASFRLKKEKTQSIYEILSPYGEISKTRIVVRNSDLKLIQIQLTLPSANYFSEHVDDESYETPLIIVDLDYNVTKHTHFDYSFESVLSKSGETYQLTEGFQSYQLYDNRIQN